MKTDDYEMLWFQLKNWITDSLLEGESGTYHTMHESFERERFMKEVLGKMIEMEEVFDKKKELLEKMNLFEDSVYFTDKTLALVAKFEIEVR